MQESPDSQGAEHWGWRRQVHWEVEVDGLTPKKQSVLCPF